MTAANYYLLGGKRKIPILKGTQTTTGIRIVTDLGILTYYVYNYAEPLLFINRFYFEYANMHTVLVYIFV